MLPLATPLPLAAADFGDRTALVAICSNSERTHPQDAEQGVAHAYRGQLDGSRPGNAIPLDGRDLRAALTAVLAGQPVAAPQIASIGCNIKWHPGREPEWAGPVPVS
jgi:hypothetical protein